jgi:hypothetical protein
MLRLLRIEILKIKNYKTFWAFLAIYAGLIILFSGSSSSTGMGPVVEVFNFPFVWKHLVQRASFFNILLGILVILLITNEFTFRTYRQNVIDGLSRDQAVIAKFALIQAIAVFCIIFLFIFGLIKGLMAGPFVHFGEIFSEVHYLLRLFLQILGYMGIAALFAFLIKKPALTIVVYLVYMVAFERMLRFVIPDAIERYLPVHVLGSLVPIDFFELFMQGLTGVQPLSFAMLAALTVGYFLLCLTFARVLMQRSAL